MKKLLPVIRILTVLILTLTLLVMYAGPALAAAPHHEAPEGSEWVMADWMFLSFIIFAGASFIAFMLALKSGALSNLEDAKYPMLEIHEEDYYTPEWAQSGDEQ